MMDDKDEKDAKEVVKKRLRVVKAIEKAVLEPPKERELDTDVKYMELVIDYFRGGGDFYIQDNDGRSLLFLLITFFHYNEDLIVEWLSEKHTLTLNAAIQDGDESYSNRSIIHYTYVEDKKTIFKYLLTRKDVDLNATCTQIWDIDNRLYYTVDKIACSTTFFRSDSLYGVDLETATIMHFAVVKKDMESIDKLCQTKRVDVNAKAHLLVDRSFIEYEKDEDKPFQPGLEKLTEGVWAPNSIDSSDEGTLLVTYRVTDVTPIQLAAILGYQPILKHLILNKADFTFADSTGTTPFLSAAEFGHLDCISYLADIPSINLQQCNYSEMNAIALAACNNHLAVVKYLHEEKRVSLEEKDQNGHTALYWSGKYNAVGTFKYLLGQGVKVTADVYKEASKSLKAFLDYKPGRKTSSVLERCQHGRISPDQIERLWLDYEDTTDDDSSDDEDIEQCEKILAKEAIVVRKEDEKKFEAHNKKVAHFNTARTEGKLNYAEHKDMRFVTYRGLHFDPKYFDKNKRKAFYQGYILKPHLPEDTLSYATAKLVEQKEKQKNKKIMTSEEIVASDAHKEVTAYLQKLKETPNKKPRPNDKRKTEYARLIQDYILFYATVIGRGGIKTDFAFSYPYNPLISTSFLPAVSFEYASGMHSPKEHRLNPHYRRSTGKAKHPIVGVVYSYAIDLQYAFENSVTILDWNHKKSIGIKGYYQYHCEVIFESIIPQQYMVKRTLLKLPDYSLDKKDTPPRLNYTVKYNKKFTINQNAVRDLKTPVGSDANIHDKNSKINNLIGHVIERESEVLSNALTEYLYNKNLYPCYPFKDKTLSTRPMKPGKIGDKWSDQKIPTADTARKNSSKIHKRLTLPDIDQAMLPLGKEKKKESKNSALSQTSQTSTPTKLLSAKADEEVTKKLNFDSPLPKNNANKPETPTATAIKATVKNTNQQLSKTDFKPNRVRKELADLAMVKHKLSAILQKANCEIEPAFSEGDCIYDAIALGINICYPDIPKKDIKSLRTLCKIFIDKLEENDALKQSLKNEHKDEYEKHLKTMAYSLPELEEIFKKKEIILEKLTKIDAELSKTKTDALKRKKEETQQELRNLNCPPDNIARWGTPEIEAYIICKELKVKLHFIRLHDDGNTIYHQLVDENGATSAVEKDIGYADPKIIYVVNYKQHFAPMLPNKKPVAALTAAAPLPAPTNTAGTKSANQQPTQLVARRTGNNDMIMLSTDSKDSKTEGYKEIDVPHDGSCSFYSVVLSALLPAVNNQQQFNAIYIRLFGIDSQLEAGRMAQLLIFLKGYDGTSKYISNSLLKKLIDGEEKQSATTNGRLRKILGDYIAHNRNASFVTTSHDEKQLGTLDDYLKRNLSKKDGFAGTLEIAALANMLNVRIAVFQETKLGLTYASSYGENATNIFYLIYIHTEGKEYKATQRHYHYLIKPEILLQLKAQPQPAAPVHKPVTTATHIATTTSAFSSTMHAPVSGLMATMGYLAPKTASSKPTNALPSPANSSATVANANIPFKPSATNIFTKK